MTHSMTHLDVEDVLTSIRRLVSDGPAQRQAEASPTLFVLTPAHRVGADEPVADADRATEELDLAQPPAELFRADTPKVEEPAPAQPEPAPMPDMSASAPPVAGEPMLLTDRITGDVADDPIPVEEALDPADSLDPATEHKNLLEQRIAELERAVGRAGDEFEPDGSEVRGFEQPKLHFLKKYRERFEVIDGDGIDRDAPSASGKLPLTEPEPEERLNTEPPLKLSEVAMFAHTPRHFEPAPADLPPEAEGGQIQPAGARDLVDGNDEFFVDEEVLRSLVSDIVRNELQGRLGERITRNVRRMVRHEIEKALSLKSLE